MFKKSLVAIFMITIILLMGCATIKTNTNEYSYEDKIQLTTSDVQNNAGTLSAGYYYSMIINADNTVGVYGIVERGRKIIGGIAAENAELISDWTDIIAISSNYSVTAGLKSDGTVLLVGFNAKGEQQQLDFINIKQIVLELPILLGLCEDNTVVVYGSGISSEQTAEVSSWTNITQVDTTRGVIWGLTSNGTIKCSDTSNEVYLKTTNWNNIKYIYCDDSDYGSPIICAIKNDGTIVYAVKEEIEERLKQEISEINTWDNIVCLKGNGANIYGLKSDGTIVSTENSPLDVYIKNNWRDIIDFSVGIYHIIGKTSKNEIVAYGSNSLGECEINSTRGREAEILVEATQNEIIYVYNKLDSVDAVPILSSDYSIKYVIDHAIKYPKITATKNQWDVYYLTISGGYVPYGSDIVAIDTSFTYIIDLGRNSIRLVNEEWTMLMESYVNDLVY